MKSQVYVPRQLPLCKPLSTLSTGGAARTGRSGCPEAGAGPAGGSPRRGRGQVHLDHLDLGRSLLHSPPGPFPLILSTRGGGRGVSGPEKGP